MDEKLLEHLQRMEELLRKYGCYGQADAVLKLVELSAKDESVFWEQLKGATMWGGSGAIWEVNFNAVADLDMSVLRRMLLSVAAAMEQKGQATPRVRQVSEGLKAISNRSS